MPPFTVKKILDEIDTLIPMPYVINALLKVLEDPDVATNEISDVISKDEALTAKILKIVNSAYFGIKNPIVNIKRATVILGVQNIKNIAIGVSLISSNSEFPSKILNRIEFWKHQLATASFAQQIANIFNFSVNTEEIFLCSFLHDIGKLAMINLMKDNYDSVVRTSIEKGIPIYKIERELFGFDHLQVGYELCKKWNFPNSFVEAIYRHHKLLSLYQNPATPQEQLEFSVILANMLSNLCALGTSGEFIADFTLIRQDILDKIVQTVEQVNKLFYQTVRVFELSHTIQIPDINTYIYVSLIDKQFEVALKLLLETNQYKMVNYQNVDDLKNKPINLVFLHDDITIQKLMLNESEISMNLKYISIIDWKNMYPGKKFNPHIFLRWFANAAKKP